MPRGVTVKLASNSETSEKNASDNVQLCGAIKTECNGPEEQVIHRKSARRRVARDIFLVFEEQPSRRQGRGCNRKKSQIKSKFGHLKVENPNASSRARAGLLRDIKNEPKCCFDPPADVPQLKSVSEKKLPERKKNVRSNVKSVRSNAAAAGEKKKKNTVTPKAKSPATVNPIFLWAKQDDTRIIEVRCEDYDKRNRIRITKTTTGWRAIPRSDASTSRIVKYFQTPSSLIKLKREIYDSKLLGRNECAAIDPSAEFFCNSSADAMAFADVTEEDQQFHIANSITTTEIESKLSVDRETEMETNDDHEDSINCNCGLNAAADIDTVIQQQECSSSGNSPDDQLSENESRISQNYYMSDAAKDAASETLTTNSDTYQTYTSELRLCPKTGFFFSSSPSKDGAASNEVEANDSGIHIDITQIDSENAPSVDSVIGSLNTEATNLKDLLDDADLLQHCNDNDDENCDSELIDSLVNRGCESTLISEDDILKAHNTSSSSCVNTFQKPNISIPSPKDSIDEGIVDNMLPQMIDTISEPHKCLSFDEAGEIVEENGALFHTLQSFSSAFERETIEHTTTTTGTGTETETTPTTTPTKTTTLNPKAIETINMPLTNATSLTEGTLSLNADAGAGESTPKDLSYRKTVESEAICVQSESQSQCAVTSSSDILLSPPRRCQDEVPVVESGTENIKNFILEQFINLNALNTLPNTTSGKQQQQQQTEIIDNDLGHRKTTVKIGSETEHTSELLIETVVIDDNSNDEPAKKKLCNNIGKKIESNMKTPLLPVSKNIDDDGDPDPLTQLQLLLRNTQWKVPDPILVPKDRLGAVLASPAREIPLLITTRPELRLPEAFAYPHIIQNPNILVISMAQLEAILKNEMEMEKTPPLPLPLPLQRNPLSDDVFPVKNIHHMATKPPKPKTQPKDLNTKCSFADSNSMATDINTATLAVINQMLWLPYIGQWSQELLSTLKNGPIGGLQNQFTNFPSPYNHSSFGLQHIDELYKTYIKQMSNSKMQMPNDDIEQATESASANFQTSPLYLRAINAFQNHVDLMLLQKLVQQQMPNFPNTDQTATTNTSSPSPSSCSSKRLDTETIAPFPESNSKLLLHRKHLHSASNNLCPAAAAAAAADYSNIGDVLLGNTLKLQKLSSEKTLAHSLEHKKQIKTKPRLTCKSLSNLLEPETRNLRGNIQFPDVQENVRGVPYMNIHSENCLQQSLPRFANAGFKQQSFVDCEKRRQCSKNLEHAQVVHIPDKATTTADLAHMQGNSTHAHTHYNSGVNGVYNSQWNWTTVTAAGE